MAKFKKRKRKDDKVIRKSSDGTDDEKEENLTDDFKQVLQEQMLLKTEKRLKKGMKVEKEVKDDKFDQAPEIAKDPNDIKVNMSGITGVTMFSRRGSDLSKKKNKDENPLMLQYVEKHLSGNKNIDSPKSMDKSKRKDQPEDKLEGMPAAWSTGYDPGE